MILSKDQGNIDRSVDEIEDWTLMLVLPASLREPKACKYA